MKQLILILIGFLFTINLFADCLSNGLSIFPHNKTINRNTIFILEGYANSQVVIHKLNQKYNIYLKSGKKKVKLIVTEVFNGAYSISQAILNPETVLEPGLEYTICIENLPKGHRPLGNYSPVTGKIEPITYKVLNDIDIEKPLLSSQPIELEKKFIRAGCGPISHVIFTNPAKDDSEIIVKTTVKSLNSGKETTYCIDTYGKNIEVGYGMCSGDFDFKDGDFYEVEFTFIDSSGNATKWSGERIKFSKPTPEKDGLKINSTYIKR